MQDKRQCVVIVGYTFSGKTTLGRKLAKRLGYGFYDLDEEIESKFHYSVADIFTKFGEDTFRKMEKDMLESLLNNNGCVISTGGGTPCFFDNMQKIKQRSLSIYLRMNEGMILSRQKQSRKVRPLFKGLSEREIAQYVHRSLEEREKYYSSADITIEGINADIDKIAQSIIAAP